MIHHLIAVQSILAYIHRLYPTCNHTTIHSTISQSTIHSRYQFVYVIFSTVCNLDIFGPAAIITTPIKADLSLYFFSKCSWMNSIHPTRCMSSTHTRGNNFLGNHCTSWRHHTIPNTPTETIITVLSIFLIT